MALFGSFSLHSEPAGGGDGMSQRLATYFSLPLISPSLAFTFLRHRSEHCRGFFPGRCRQICVHLLPSFACAGRWC